MTFNTSSAPVGTHDLPVGADWGERWRATQKAVAAHRRGERTPVAFAAWEPEVVV